MRGQLTSEQIEVLLRPIHKHRVKQTQGMSHLEAFDVTAHLSRIFGFGGWDKEILTLELLREQKGHDDKADKKGWYVTYRCTMRLTIFNQAGEVVTVKEDGATGSAQNQPDYGDAHDLAMKNAISNALKRCAKDLGDQMGLGLYDKGSTAPLVKKVVGFNPPGDEEAA